MSNLVRDLLLATRTLLKRPGFAAVTVLTLALGIGANSAIFSVVNAVLLEPLPYEEPDALINTWTQFPEEGRSRFPSSEAEFLDYRAETDLFEELGAFACGPAVLTGDEHPLRITGCMTSAGLWSVLRSEAKLGRVFLPDEDRPGGAPIVVLSDGLWQSRFGGDPDIVDRAIVLDGESYTVVGVMPEAFTFPSQGAQLCVPLVLDRASITDRSGHYLTVIGRVRAGIGLPQVLAEMDVVSERWARDYEHAHPLTALTMKEQLVGNVRTLLFVLLGTVGLVLLIACVNVASLFLARAEGRQKEMAIRTALGAGRARLLSQTLAESLVLALVGGALGLLFAVWGVDVLLAMEPGNLPRVDRIGVDAAVAAFTLAVSVLSALTFGLVPGLRASRQSLGPALTSGAREVGESARRPRLRGILVVAEIALAVVLVVGSTLLLRSFWNLLQIQPGIEPTGVLSARISLPEARYPDPGDVQAFFPELVHKLETLPGVRSVSHVSNLPFAQGLRTERFEHVDREFRPEDPVPAVGHQTVSPGYFRTLGIPLRGRDFTANDTKSSPRVVIVNETLARSFFRREEALGQRIRIYASKPREVPFEIVGVVGDVRHEGLAVPSQPTVFVPHAQESFYGYGLPRRATLVVRTDIAPGTLAEPLRRAAWQLDPDLAISDLTTMEALLTRSVARQRLTTLLLAVFSAVALLLAAVGVYGLLSQVVGGRTRELGVRIALGASRSDVVRLVLGQGLALTLIGIAMGLFVSLAMGRVLSSLLFEVSATDGASFAATAVILFAVAVVACYVPARRAASVDPTEALRSE